MNTTEKAQRTEAIDKRAHISAELRRLAEEVKGITIDTQYDLAGLLRLVADILKK